MPLNERETDEVAAALPAVLCETEKSGREGPEKRLEGRFLGPESIFIAKEP